MRGRTLRVEPWPDERFVPDALITCEGAPFLDPNGTQIGQVLEHEVIGDRLFLIIRLDE